MTLEFPALKLSMYARIVGYAECAFWGINAPANAPYACREIWSYPERMMLERALLEAQEELENVLNYPMSARWFTSERKPWASSYVTRWGKLLAGGIISDTMLQAGATVDYTTDPAIITVDLGDCLPGDVHVFLPGTDIEVEISTIGLTPGSTPVTYDIAIPRCRLVDEGYLDNPPEGYDYADVATWGTPTVDVRCITNDPSTQAILISRGCCTTVPCTDVRDTGCIYVKNYDLGFVEVTPAVYASGSWLKACTWPCYSEFVELNYYAGLTGLTRQQGDTLIRLAHSKMPTEPCGCDVTQRLWKRDRNIPEILDANRLECPFGMSDGAWIAWKFANTYNLRRGSVMFGKRSINA